MRIRKLVLGIVLACSCVVDAQPIPKKRRSRRIKNSKLKIQQNWIRKISDFLADDKKAGPVLKKLLMNYFQIKNLDNKLFKKLNATYLSSDRKEFLQEILRNLPVDFSFKTLFKNLQAYKSQKKSVKTDTEKSVDSPTSSAKPLKDWDLFVSNLYQPGYYVNAVDPGSIAGRAYHFENHRPRYPTKGEQMGQYIGPGSPNRSSSKVKTGHKDDGRAETLGRRRSSRFYP